MQQSAPEDFGAYIGIDWADQTHFVSLRDANSQEVKRYKLEQKPEVLSQWGKRVAATISRTTGSGGAGTNARCLDLRPNEL
jgi:hypothetical protein